MVSREGMRRANRKAVPRSWALTCAVILSTVSGEMDGMQMAGESISPPAALDSCTL